MENLQAKILLAEDRVEDAYLTEFALDKAGYQGIIHWVKDGAELLDYLFCTGKYDNRTPENPILILLDLNMPKLNGLEALKKIKADIKMRTIPVVILTTSKEELDRSMAYENFVNSYIVKPVNTEKFNEAIHELGSYWLARNLPIT